MMAYIYIYIYIYWYIKCEGIIAWACPMKTSHLQWPVCQLSVAASAYAIKKACVYGFNRRLQWLHVVSLVS